MIHLNRLLLAGMVALAVGTGPSVGRGGEPAEPEMAPAPKEADAACPCPVLKKKEEPKTLFEWSLCKEEEEEDEEEDCSTENGNGKADKAEGNADAGDSAAASDDEDSKDEANDKTCKPKAPVYWYRESVHEHRAAIKREPLESDRPDFTEASSTVGRGIVQLEAGYTYIRDRDILGTRTSSHSYPEMLWRIGLFADWFELRIAQNFGHQSGEMEEITDAVGGAEDLYLGVKLGLTEQKDWLPEMALILQMTVPTGHDAFTADQVLFGFNWLYGWDIIEDCVSFAGSTQANRAVDDLGHYYVELAQSFTIGYTLTRKLGAYTEWFAIFPNGSVDPLVGPQYYFDGGFTYKLTNDLQLDIRAGIGVNRHADDFFAGTGFVKRFCSPLARRASEGNT